MTAPAQSPTTGGEAIAGFADPDAIGGTRPAMRDLVGRTVVIRPTRFEERVAGVEPGTTQDRITADVLVIDGGPLTFGGNPARGKPNTMTTIAPYLVTGMYISNSNVVAAVKGQVGRGVVLGRIKMGVASTPTRNAPFNLVSLDSDDPARAMAFALYNQVINQQFINPVPVQIGAVVAQDAPTHVQAAQLNIAQQYAAAAPTPPPAPAVDPQAAFLAWQAANTPQPSPGMPPAPNGWDAGTWAGLKPEQRQQILDQKPPFA